MPTQHTIPTEVVKNFWVDSFRKKCRKKEAFWVAMNLKNAYERKGNPYYNGEITFAIHLLPISK